MSDEQPDLSIVVPMFNEADGLDVLFGRLLPVLESITSCWEIICVNDGSEDTTLTLLRHWHQVEPRIRVLSLSRNFGKEAALTAGLDRAQGKAVVPLDADLQDPPELIRELVAKWREGFKVVLAIRQNRTGDSWSKRQSALVYYKMMKLLKINLPENSGDFRLMDQQVVSVLRLLPERSRFMKGLFSWVGFSTACIYFDRPARSAGPAKHTLRSLLSLAKDGLFSFTVLPLRFATFIGLAISCFSFCYAGLLILRTLALGVDTPGYASVMASVLCLGGIQLFSIGIIGEYLGRVYEEVKHRPLFIVEEHL